MPRRLLLIVTVTALARFGAAVQAQTQAPYKIHVESNQLQAPIRAESDLVLVPVFVFDKQRTYYVSSWEWQCVRNQRAIFFNLLPSQPYTGPECYDDEVRDLTAKDFRIFQDGVEQRILRVVLEGWLTAPRDNMTYHYERCFTPAGIWSSTDVERHWWDTYERRYYSLAYVPANPNPGCHSLKVEVDRPGTMVFARDQYCNGQTPSDALFGTKYDTQLQSDLTSEKKRRIPLTLQAGYFYTDTGEARVQVALEFPWTDLKCQWDLPTATLRASIGLLGMFYARDGRPRGRFSDVLYPSYWPTFLQGGYRPAQNAALSGDAVYILKYAMDLYDRSWLPTRYETQANLPEGEYELRVVLSDTEKFGRAELPLTIDHRDPSGLSLSSVMLCKRFRDAHVAAVERAAENFAPLYVPLVSKGIEFTPTGDVRFKHGEPLIPYFEVYEPLLSVQPATGGQATPSGGPAIPAPARTQGGQSSVGASATLTVQAHIRIVDATTGQLIKDFPPVDAAPYERAGSSMIPIAREIPFDQLPKGAYRLEVQATDSAGRSTPWRTSNFSVEQNR